MDAKPRAITADELRDQLLDHMRYLVKYWANIEHITVQEKIEGYSHSVLAMLDGCTTEFPAFDLVAKPHEDDKQYCIDNDQNWIEDETRISNMLHEHWYKR